MTIPSHLIMHGPEPEVIAITSPMPLLPQCTHLRAQRKCCSDLYICVVHGDCTLGYVENSALKVCNACEDWVPANPIAPLRDNFRYAPWEGAYKTKPWEYRVTVAIPCLDASEAVAVIVESYRKQTVPPFIMLIDTGSVPAELAALQALAGEDVEVHSIRLNGVQHPSDFPAMAMDLAFTLCRTEFLLATHADCFPVNTQVLAEMLSHNTAVVGYELTERDHSDWRGMVGHTLTMFRMVDMDRINGGWSMRRLLSQFSHPDGKPTALSIATSPNWPDTELLINYQCRAAGIVPVIIGTEKNSARTIDHRIDHCRSVASATLYDAGSVYAEAAKLWIVDAIEKARARNAL